ncbi:MAG TPA: threonine/serine dehydratase [Asanoa sp.]
MVDLADIQAAADAIEGAVVRTPLLPVPWDLELFVKPESLQPVGSFKLRGATNAIARLDADRRERGVVTHSSGNHGQALAWAARAAGAPCTVVIPEGAPKIKIDAVRSFGADVVLVPPGARESTARELADRYGFTMIPPYDHRDIIAGQGTVGLEIVADLPDVGVVLVPVGGGGLSSGVSTAVKALRPGTAVIGVEPALAPDARESFDRGELVPLTDEQRYLTIADGLRTSLSALTLAHLRAHLYAIVSVTEDEIAEATSRLIRETRLVVEPSGAVATAARLFHRDELPAGRTVAVISGGNLDPSLLVGYAAGRTSPQS